MFTFKTNDLHEIAASKKLQESLYKRTLIVVLLSQTLGGAGLAAGIAVGALLAREMLGFDSLTGLPMALFTLGSALSAYIVGQTAQKHGRRLGLSFGFLAGGLGGFGVALAAVFHNVALLFISLFIYGAGSSTNLQARYAGTDLAKPHQRAKAASIAMVATTFGAVLGPNVITPMGKVAEALGIPALAGPFLLAAIAYSLAGLVLFFFLKPEPLKVAQLIAEYEKKSESIMKGEMSTTQIQHVGVYIGAIILISTHFIMVAIMTMTPIHMEHYGSSLSAVGLIIGLHIAAMYLPSLVTGSLVDRLGRGIMGIAAAVTLALAGIVAAFAQGDSLILLAIALILLGLGWNFGLITGTAMVVDATNVQIRAKTQGKIDVGVALGGATGGILSSFIFAMTSYSILSLVGALLSLLLIPLLLWVKYKKHMYF